MLLRRVVCVLSERRALPCISVKRRIAGSIVVIKEHEVYTRIYCTASVAATCRHISLSLAVGIRLFLIHLLYRLLHFTADSLVLSTGGTSVAVSRAVRKV